MENKKQSSSRQIMWLVVGIGLIGIIASALLSGGGSSGTSAPDTTSVIDSSNLSATVHMTNNGITVVNNEATTWSDCMVGVNGSLGWGFDNPPYKTHSPLSFNPSVKKLVPYSAISADDGTVFDFNTHTVNTAVIVCNGSGSERSWTGGTQ